MNAIGCDVAQNTRVCLLFEAKIINSPFRFLAQPLAISVSKMNARHVSTRAFATMAHLYRRHASVALYFFRL